MPLRLLLSAGEMHDSQLAPALLADFFRDAVVLADKGYAADGTARSSKCMLDAEPTVPMNQTGSLYGLTGPRH